MTAPATVNRTRLIQSRAVLSFGLLVGLGILILLVGGSIMLGAADISFSTIWDSIFAYNDTLFQHLVIRTARLPRVVSGLMVGASLAVAGGMMQGITRNPLASPDILGVNSGAAFAVVLVVYTVGNATLSVYAIASIIGASLSAVIVYALGSMGRSGTTPLKLTLAGVIFTSFMGSFTTMILIRDERTLEQIRFWTVGSLAGREWSLFAQTAPYMVLGLIGGIVLARQITTISLGEDIATGLGQNTIVIKGLSAVVVVLLAGGAVALAGPVGFVGLVAPHLARFLVGQDYRWVLPYSALIGGALVVIGDIGARMIIRPQELPVGIMLAMFGAPFFIYLARWKVK